MFKLKGINKSFFVWIVLCLAYLSLIGYLTWLYPYGGDELVPSSLTFKENIKQLIFNPYMSLRVGCLLGIPLFSMGKGAFIILNSILQLTVIFSAFYLIYMRFPLLNSFNDLPAFILILVLGTFFVAQPSDVLIWFGGATNYAWVFIAFIWFLVYLRKLDDGKSFTNRYFVLFCLFWGLFLGMMNENNSPMVLCLMSAFFAYSYFKGIKLKKDFLLLFIGSAIGVYFMFAFGDNEIRLKIVSFGFPMHHTLSEKLIIHLHRMNEFSASNLCLIYLLPLFLFLLGLDKRKIVFKEKHFYLSVICWLVALGLSVVLCAAPHLANRAFYSATWFCIFSLIFMLMMVEKLYQIKLIKYFAFIFGILFIYILPLFILQVSTLKKNVNYRQGLIDNAKQKGRKTVYVPYAKAQKYLTDNLEVLYWDSLKIKKKWSAIESIEVESELSDNILYM